MKSILFRDLRGLDMKTIYKTKDGKKEILELYDRQLKRLAVPFQDVYIETSFGKTHLIETGSLSGEPLLVFHGGNATTAYNLLACGFLFEDFHIYAVDTIGHPGKSASMMLPMILYWITKKDKWLRKCILPMAVTEEAITDDLYQTAKLSIDHVKVKTAMPSDVGKKRMQKCKAPTFVMAAERDCLFPGAGVIATAEKIILDCRTLLLKGRGHINALSDDEKKMIVDL